MELLARLAATAGVAVAILTWRDALRARREASRAKAALEDLDGRD